MSAKISGELFIRHTRDLNTVMVAGVLRLPADIRFDGDTCYYVSGFNYGGTPLLMVHNEGKECIAEVSRGLRIDQVVVDRKWRIPLLKAGQSIGKPTIMQIEGDYF